MKYTLKFLLCIALCFSLYDCKKDRLVEVAYNSSQIEYMGRVDSIPGEAMNFYWSGTSAKINFTGSSISVALSDTGDNYYNLILDNDSIILLHPGAEKQSYPIASNLSESEHSLEIFKRTQWSRGTSQFYGFTVTGKNASLLPKSGEKEHKIEFYGNSITAGHAVEDTSNYDRPDSIFTNNYLSYSAITARHYDAQYSCICKSGIGITISWFPILMPEIYNRIDPCNSASKWDFSLYTPDIVVVNLFQNDSWLVNLPDRAEFKKYFGTEPPTDEYLVKAYQDFIVSLRGKYTTSKIICMLGNMDITNEGSKWPGIVQTAADGLNDSLIYTLFVPYKNTPFHPRISEQQDMANNLIKFIDEEVRW